MQAWVLSNPDTEEGLAGGGGGGGDSANYLMLFINYTPPDEKYTPPPFLLSAFYFIRALTAGERLSVVLAPVLADLIEDIFHKLETRWGGRRGGYLCF